MIISRWQLWLDCNRETSLTALKLCISMNLFRKVLKEVKRGNLLEVHWMKIRECKSSSLLKLTIKINSNKISTLTTITWWWLNQLKTHLLTSIGIKSILKLILESRKLHMTILESAELICFRNITQINRMNSLRKICILLAVGG